MNPSVSINGIEQLQIVLGKLEQAIDPERILDEAGAIMLNRIRTRFLDEVDPDNTPWPPSKSGLTRRAGGYTYRGGKKYTGTGTLFETGALFHSIQLYKDQERTRRISTDVPYAKYLQEGTSSMPARVFLGFGQQDVGVVEKLIIRRIEGAVSRG